MATMAREGMADGVALQQVENVKQALELAKKRGVTAVLAEIDSVMELESLSEATRKAPLLALVRGGDKALELLDAGAVEALPLPVEARRLGFAIERVMELARLRMEALRLREAGQRPWIGASPATRALLERAEKLAQHDATVLISGEAGSGKEMLARFIHSKSRRADQLFVRADTGSPASLAASMLYAQGGTLYLHHVDELSAELQAMALQAVKESLLNFEGRETRLDLRVMSATREALRERVHQGRFREDLYWALAGVAVEVPPLRERSGDIEELFHHYLNQASRRLARKAPGIPLKIFSLLKAHPYPGNVFELKQLAGLVACLSDESEISAAALPAEYLAPIQLGRSPQSASLALKPAVHEFERQYLLRVLKAVGFNQSKAAQALDIHRNTLILKMQELGIPNRREKTRKS